MPFTRSSIQRSLSLSSVYGTFRLQHLLLIYTPTFKCLSLLFELAYLITRQLGQLQCCTVKPVLSGHPRGML